MSGSCLPKAQPMCGDADAPPLHIGFTWLMQYPRCRRSRATDAEIAVTWATC